MDFQLLLMSSNLQEVFDKLEKSILPKVPRINFGGSRDAQAKEGVQSCLLACIQEASNAKEMARGESGDAYSFVAPPS